MSTKAPWREIIREQLKMLSSESDQREYARNVSNVDISVELVCGWFDDSYHPNDPHFRECFQEPELTSLAKFHSLFDSRLTELPKSNGRIESWLGSPHWHEVMSAAGNTLMVLKE
jgi:hypothetical protein